MASPMYLSSVPRCSAITAVMAEKNRFTSSRSACGDSDSEICVKLRMSQNMTLSSRFSACMV